jgi:hypothetical protein
MRDLAYPGEILTHLGRGCESAGKTTGRTIKPIVLSAMGAGGITNGMICFVMRNRSRIIQISGDDGGKAIANHIHKPTNQLQCPFAFM